MRKTLWTRSAACLLATAVALCVCACGSSDKSGTGDAQHGKPGKPKRIIARPQDSTADMISAVSASKGARAVDVKFDVTDRPQPGQPVAVRVALIPVDPAVLGVAVKFAGDDGLELIKGEDAPAADKPAPGVPIRRTVTVMPKTDGIYALTATVTSTTENDSRTTVFSIPVIAGAGMPELAAKSESGSKRPPAQ